MSIKLKVSYFFLVFIFFYFNAIKSYLNFDIYFYDFGIFLKYIATSFSFENFWLRPILLFFKIFNNKESIIFLPFTLIFFNIFFVLLPMTLIIKNSNYNYIYYFYPFFFFTGNFINAGLQTDILYIYFCFLNFRYFENKNYYLFTLTLIAIFLIKSVIFIVHLYFFFSLFYLKDFIKFNFFKKSFFGKCLLMILIILLIILFYFIMSYTNFDRFAYLASHLLLVLVYFLILPKLNFYFFIAYSLFVFLVFAFNYSFLSINHHFVVYFLGPFFYLLLKPNTSSDVNRMYIIIFLLINFLITLLVSNSFFSYTKLKEYKFSINNIFINYFSIKDISKSNYYFVYQNNLFFYPGHNNFDVFKLSSLKFSQKNLIFILNSQNKFFIDDKECNLNFNFCKKSRFLNLDINLQEVKKFIEQDLKLINTYEKFNLYSLK